MRTVGAYEAKTHLPQLLREVEGGATITITRHGVAVAVLAPAGHGMRSDVQATIEAIHKLRAEVKPLAGSSIREMIEEGRRF